MRSIIASLLLVAAAAAGAQINPTSQINWPAATGSGAPGGTCAAPEYGMPYTDTTANVQYVCSTSGWVQVSGGGGGVTWPTSGDAVISNGTNTPTGVAEVDGDCLLGASGAWTTGDCGGGGGGTSVEVNGGSGLSTANLNGTTPAAPSNNINCTWQVSGSNVSCYVPFLSATDTRPTQVTSVEYVTVAAGASYTFSTSPTSPSTAGTATYLHITLGTNSVPTDSANIAQNSTLAITCDGETNTVSLGMFFAGMDAPLAFASDWIAQTLGTSNQNVNSMNRRLEINYSTGCTFVFTNASQVSNTTLFAEVSYRVGANVSRPTRQYWHANSVQLQQVAQYASFPMLVQTGAGGGGEIESETLYVRSPTNCIYEEGDPTVTTDGNTAVTANGTEDFFGSGYNSVNSKGGLQIGKWGQFTASGFSECSSVSNPLAGLGNPPNIYDALLYRFFSTTDSDNVLFTSSLAAAWPNGQSGEGGEGPGTVWAQGLTTFWTDNPRAAPVTYSPSTEAQASGNFPLTVALASSTSGVTFCYTTDGSTPIGNGAGGCTHGSSGSSVTVSSAGTTVMAVASESGYADSAPSSIFYYVNNTLGFVSGNTRSSGATSVTSITSDSITWTAGDHAVILCRSGDDAAIAGPISLIASVNALIETVGITGTSTNGQEAVYYVDTMPAGAATFTCRAAYSNPYMGVVVLQYHSGTTHANVGTGINTASSLTSTTPSFSTTGAGLIVACFDPQFGATSLTAGLIGGVSSTGRESSVNFMCEDVITSGAQTSITAAMTATGTAGFWGNGVITFQ